MAVILVAPREIDTIKCKSLTLEPVGIAFYGQCTGMTSMRKCKSTSELLQIMASKSLF